jgi:hypothetical protein
MRGNRDVLRRIADANDRLMRSPLFLQVQQRQARRWRALGLTEKGKFSLVLPSASRQPATGGSSRLARRPPARSNPNRDTETSLGRSMMRNEIRLIRLGVYSAT